MSTPIPAPASATVIRLPNARAGEPYSQAISLPEAPGEAVVPGACALPAGLDLAFDPASGALHGIPATPGDYRFTVSLRLASDAPNFSRDVEVQVLVNPDPRSLWKDLPSDRQAPYWRADEDCASLRGKHLRIIAASKRGRSHAHVGSFRDDDVRIAMVAEAGWAIAVVADGAGSARYSRQGAALICQVARDRLTAALAGAAGQAIDIAAQSWCDARAGGAGGDAKPEHATSASLAHQQLHQTLSSVVGTAAYYAAKAIVDEADTRAAELQAAVRDYASTAQIAICKRYPFGTLCAAYWVGDGAVGLYSEQAGVILLGEVDSGEYAGQTRFLEGHEVTAEALLKRTRFAVAEHMTALVLMTDGVTDPKFETEARLARAADWDALWQDLDGAVGLSTDAEGQEQRLLAWLDFWSQGDHDDRSIAIIQ